MGEKNSVIGMSKERMRVNIKKDRVERGSRMYVWIRVKSKEYKGIFEIGGSRSLMWEGFGKKRGVRLIGDCLEIDGGIRV